MGRKGLSFAMKVIAGLVLGVLVILATVFVLNDQSDNLLCFASQSLDTSLGAECGSN